MVMNISRFRKLGRQLQLHFVRHKGGYSNFGHKYVPESKHTVLWTAFLALNMVGFMMDWEFVWHYVSGKEGEYRKRSIQVPTGE